MLTLTGDAPACEHRYITSTRETGWMCADCGVRLLSLMLPIPLPTIAKAIAVLADAAPTPPEDR